MGKYTSPVEKIMQVNWLPSSQQINALLTVFAYSVGVWKSLFSLLKLLVYVVVTKELGIYRRSFLSDYAFLIKYRNINGLST